MNETRVQKSQNAKFARTRRSHRQDKTWRLSNPRSAHPREITNQTRTCEPCVDCSTSTEVSKLQKEVKRRSSSYSQ